MIALYTAYRIHLVYVSEKRLSRRETGLFLRRSEVVQTLQPEGKEGRGKDRRRKREEKEGRMREKRRKKSEEREKCFNGCLEKGSIDGVYWEFAHNFPCCKKPERGSANIASPPPLRGNNRLLRSLVSFSAVKNFCKSCRKLRFERPL